MLLSLVAVICLEFRAVMVARENSFPTVVFQKVLCLSFAQNIYKISKCRNAFIAVNKWGCVLVLDGSKFVFLSFISMKTKMNSQMWSYTVVHTFFFTFSIPPAALSTWPQKWKKHNTLILTIQYLIYFYIVIQTRSHTIKSLANQIKLY